MARNASPNNTLEATGTDAQLQPPEPPPPAHVHAAHSEAELELETEVDDDASSSSSSSSREATELRSICSSVHRQDQIERHSSMLARRRTSSEMTAQTAPDEAPATEAWRCRLKRQPNKRRWHDGIRRWWARNIRVTVPAEARRDHLALERTYLGYLRTSIALSMCGVVIAQLFRLQHSPTPDHVLGYHVLGIPLGACFIIAAILVAALGAFRFWRQQNAITRGKILAGGWEIYCIMVGGIALTVVLFAFSVVVDVRKEDR